MILVVYLGHGRFRPVKQLYLNPNLFLGEVLSSHMEGESLGKKVVHLNRSKRHNQTATIYSPY